MRISQPLFLVCAATSLVMLPLHSLAEEIPCAIRSDIPASVSEAPPAGRTVIPSFTLSLSEPRSVSEESGEANRSPIYACACGCGVFEVATATMLPKGEGGKVWLEWDYQNQNRNRRGGSKAPAEDNEDKDIRTDFFTFGFQYFFNRAWGIQAEVPLAHRHFTTADGTVDWTSLGDVRLKGVYTGFSEDQSIGIDFGVKLATGNFTHPGPDRDTQIGSGSTDLLFGGFYRNYLTADQKWNYFAQIEADLPAITQDQYRPGFELDAAVGVYYSGLSFGHVKVSPVGQIIASYRTSDGGNNSAQPVASGYERLLLSPGVEFDFHPFMIYGDVEIPVYQYFKGDQLAAPALFKVIVSYEF